eukprot:1156945-Pelagomonas_calceolata.AAC.3
MQANKHLAVIHKSICRSKVGTTPTAVHAHMLQVAKSVRAQVWRTCVAYVAYLWLPKHAWRICGNKFMRGAPAARVAYLWKQNHAWRTCSKICVCGEPSFGRPHHNCATLDNQHPCTCTQHLWGMHVLEAAASSPLSCKRTLGRCRDILWPATLQLCDLRSSTPPHLHPGGSLKSSSCRSTNLQESRQVPQHPLASHATA